jgi:exopolysaccharide biosynthesis polyprenyl glycosylphosphotransferase
MGAIFAAAALNAQSDGALDASIGAVVGFAGGQTFLHLAGVTRLILDSNPLAFLRGIMRSLLAGILLAAILFISFPAFSRGYLIAWSLAVGLLLVCRPVLRALAPGKLVKALMILGPLHKTENLYRELAGGKQVVRDDEIPDDLRLNMGEECVSRIVIADPRLSADHDLAALIDSRMHGLKVEQGVESCETMRGKIWIEGLQPEWWIYSNGFIPSRACRAIKQVADLAGAVVLLLFIWPLLLLAAAAIKLTSKGPVFYRQERVGLLDRKFMAIKFRSMRVDAEAASGPQWAAVNDNRITPVGHILRRFRIDELPQLFNVLKREMSLIGPRPERRVFVDMLKRHIPYYDVRHSVRPGITGWAQVNYPYGASVSDAYEKLQYDLYYTKHMSLALDALIIFKTLKVVLAGDGR